MASVVPKNERTRTAAATSTKRKMYQRGTTRLTYTTFPYLIPVRNRERSLTSGERHGRHGDKGNEWGRMVRARRHLTPSPPHSCFLHFCFSRPKHLLLYTCVPICIMEGGLVSTQGCGHVPLANFFTLTLLDASRRGHPPIMALQVSSKTSYYHQILGSSFPCLSDCTHPSCPFPLEHALSSFLGRTSLLSRLCFGAVLYACFCIWSFSELSFIKQIPWRYS
ncbi:hypothetical protein BDV97DRAFT_27487 [Delphinella strobiligena]|nr:hypothetical protein BDV97DRAFT_27487 [Delphinella strobiligena]